LFHVRQQARREVLFMHPVLLMTRLALLAFGALMARAPWRPHSPIRTSRSRRPTATAW
jgi:hypothetical protein